MLPSPRHLVVEVKTEASYNIIQSNRYSFSPYSVMQSNKATPQILSITMKLDQHLCDKITFSKVEFSESPLYYVTFYYRNKKRTCNMQM